MAGPSRRSRRTRRAPSTRAKSEEEQETTGREEEEEDEEGKEAEGDTGDGTEDDEEMADGDDAQGDEDEQDVKKTGTPKVQRRSRRGRKPSARSLKSKSPIKTGRRRPRSTNSSDDQQPKSDDGSSGGSDVEDAKVEESKQPATRQRKSRRRRQSSATKSDDGSSEDDEDENGKDDGKSVKDDGQKQPAVGQRKTRRRRQAASTKSDEGSSLDSENDGDVEESDGKKASKEEGPKQRSTRQRKTRRRQAVSNESDEGSSSDSENDVDGEMNDGKGGPKQPARGQRNKRKRKQILSTKSDEASSDDSENEDGGNDTKKKSRRVSNANDLGPKQSVIGQRKSRRRRKISSAKSDEESSDDSGNDDAENEAAEKKSTDDSESETKDISQNTEQEEDSDDEPLSAKLKRKREAANKKSKLGRNALKKLKAIERGDQDKDESANVSLDKKISGSEDGSPSTPVNKREGKMVKRRRTRRTRTTKLSVSQSVGNGDESDHRPRKRTRGRGRGARGDANENSSNPASSNPASANEEDSADDSNEDNDDDKSMAGSLSKSEKMQDDDSASTVDDNDSREKTAVLTNDNDGVGDAAADEPPSEAKQTNTASALPSASDATAKDADLNSEGKGKKSLSVSTRSRSHGVAGDEASVDDKVSEAESSRGSRRSRRKRRKPHKLAGEDELDEGNESERSEETKRDIPTNIDSGEYGQKRQVDAIQSEDDEEGSDSSRNSKRTKNPKETVTSRKDAILSKPKEKSTEAPKSEESPNEEVKGTPIKSNVQKSTGVVSSDADVSNMKSSEGNEAVDTQQGPHESAEVVPESKEGSASRDSCKQLEDQEQLQSRENEESQESRREDSLAEDSSALNSGKLESDIKAPTIKAPESKIPPKEEAEKKKDCTAKGASQIQSKTETSSADAKIDVDVEIDVNVNKEVEKAARSDEDSSQSNEKKGSQPVVDKDLVGKDQVVATERIEQNSEINTHERKDDNTLENDEPLHHTISSTNSSNEDSKAVKTSNMVESVSPEAEAKMPGEEAPLLEKKEQRLEDLASAEVPVVESHVSKDTKERLHNDGESSEQGGNDSKTAKGPRETASSSEVNGKDLSKIEAEENKMTIDTTATVVVEGCEQDSRISKDVTSGKEESLESHKTDSQQDEVIDKGPFESLINQSSKAHEENLLETNAAQGAEPTTLATALHENSVGAPATSLADSSVLEKCKPSIISPEDAQTLNQDQQTKRESKDDGMRPVNSSTATGDTFLEAKTKAEESDDETEQFHDAHMELPAEESSPSRKNKKNDSAEDAIVLRKEGRDNNTEPEIQMMPAKTSSTIVANAPNSESHSLSEPPVTNMPDQPEAIASSEDPVKGTEESTPVTTLKALSPLMSVPKEATTVPEEPVEAMATQSQRGKLTQDGSKTDHYIPVKGNSKENEEALRKSRKEEETLAKPSCDRTDDMAEDEGASQKTDSTPELCSIALDIDYNVTFGPSGPIQPLQTVTPPSSRGSSSELDKLSEIKALLYSVGSKTHKGRGFERVFAEYWDALSLRLSDRLSSHAVKRCERAINCFLTTRKLRKIHNKLIMAIMNKATRNFTSFRDIRDHLPANLRNRISKRAELSKRLERREVLEVNPASVTAKAASDQDHSLYREAWDEQVAELDTTGPKSSTLPSDPPKSSCIPGALSIDPLVRKLSAENDMQVSELAIWLMVVAAKEHVTSVLKSSISQREAIRNGELGARRGILPKVLASSTKNAAKKESPVDHNKTATTSQPNTEVKNLTAMDIYMGSTTMPIGSAGSLGGSISCSALERCLHSSFEHLKQTPTRGFVTVQEFLTDQILAEALTRKVPAKSTNDAPPSKHSEAKEKSFAVPAPTPGPTRRPHTQEPNKENTEVVKTTEAAQNSEGLQKLAPRGMGRGAKNLAALMRRSTATPSAESEADTNAGNVEGTTSTSPKPTDTNVASRNSIETGAGKESTTSISSTVGTNAVSANATVEKIAPTNGNEELKDDSESSGGAQRRGKGFGIKNLAAMRARATTKDSNTADDGPGKNDTSTL